MSLIQDKGGSALRTLTTSANPQTRLMEFMSAYAAAPNDADIDVRIGLTGTGEPCIVIDILGQAHGFTAREARIMADIAEEAMNAHPNDPEAASLPNLILCLRYGADGAEKAAAMAKP